MISKALIICVFLNNVSGLFLECNNHFGKNKKILTEDFFFIMNHSHFLYQY